MDYSFRGLLTISLWEILQVLKDRWGRLMVFLPYPMRSDPNWIEGQHIDRIRYTLGEDYYIPPISRNWSEETIFADIRCSNPDVPVIPYPVQLIDFFDLHDQVGKWTMLSKTSERPQVPFDQLIDLGIQCE